MSSNTAPESMWVKFFTDAGLPSGIAATYSLTFTENRIQMNMLLDLNKEYLREMGVSRMGDVIAILRHAKEVHEETARDRILNSTGPKVPVAAVTGRPGQPKPASPVTRMLEHYTRNTNVSSTPTSAVMNVKDRLGAIHIAGTKRKVVSPGTKSSSPEIADGRGDDAVGSKHIRQTIIQKNVYDDEIAPKVELKPLLSQKKVSSVFSRLGINEETKPPTSVLSKVTITGLKQPITKTSNNSKTVFSRLGGKDDDLGIRRDSTDSNEALKYQGILLKTTPTHKKIVLKRPVVLGTPKPAKKMGTMRADEEPVSVRDKLPLSHQQRKSVKFSPHVDYKEIEKRPAISVPKKVVTNNTRTVALSKVTKIVPSSVLTKKVVRPVSANKSNIKMRLGNRNAIVKNNKPGVFSRLGVSSRA